jgi:hypothetical protein
MRPLSGGKWCKRFLPSTRLNEDKLEEFGAPIASRGSFAKRSQLLHRTTDGIRPTIRTHVKIKNNLGLHV